MGCGKSSLAKAAAPATPEDAAAVQPQRLLQRDYEVMEQIGK
jgi:hypothetical protein